MKGPGENDQARGVGAGGTEGPERRGIARGDKRGSRKGLAGSEGRIDAIASTIASSHLSKCPCHIRSLTVPSPATIFTNHFLPSAHEEEDATQIIVPVSTSLVRVPEPVRTCRRSASPNNPPALLPPNHMSLAQFEAFPGSVDLPSDVLLLVKQYMRSARLSQQPLIMAPAGKFLLLEDTQPRSCRKLRPFSDRARKEFLKTAERVAAKPWSLERASDWLQDVVKMWEKGEVSQADLPSIDFASSGARVYEPVCVTECTEWHDFAPKTPKAVCVEDIVDRPSGKRRRLRGKQPLGPDGVGCSKCRFSRRGCARCRSRCAAAASSLAPEPSSPAGLAAASSLAPEPSSPAGLAGPASPMDEVGPPDSQSDEAGPNTSDEGT